MSYDEMRGIGGTIGLVLLFAGFVGVLVYALWPGNRARFRADARIPLDDDQDDTRADGYRGGNQKGS